eukprot:3699700-Rhodomonas_salina.2
MPEPGQSTRYRRDIGKGNGLVDPAGKFLVYLIGEPLFTLKSQTMSVAPTKYKKPVTSYARDAMSGTGIRYGTVCLSARYAMSGTGIRYGTVCLRACYAMSGTDVAYGATRMTQMTSRMEACKWSLYTGSLLAPVHLQYAIAHGDPIRVVTAPLFLHLHMERIYLRMLSCKRESSSDACTHVHIERIGGNTHGHLCFLTTVSYAVSGTDLGYPATSFRAHDTRNGAQYTGSVSLSSYGSAMQCPVLKYAMLLPGLGEIVMIAGATAVVYSPIQVDPTTRCPVLTIHMLLSCPVLTCRVLRVCLRACYAMPGTEMPFFRCSTLNGSSTDIPTM